MNQLILDHARGQVAKLRQRCAETFDVDWWEYHVVSRELRDALVRLHQLERSIEGR